ncbi:chemotaxis-specific protein-glutamate methyltransferase CheB [Edaphobacter albus]|uniref:chemotaxis-specific protein-glutamate methyltransferase CheB n=1 Tax=Edaphobacter sp. 4G125 TaxID=2763071 RepID=UPI001644481D|nr:chemotaxis-specific protein-glutamate methyltransferase CheB [Edaphobacter sp. 4G125]QNI38321.1 chemotaxis-specific protein-glutamate methyltransferase CheB [Edaphobacter sp. 4G125]
MSSFETQPLRVLAADDSAVIREVMRTLFKRYSGSRRSDLPQMELVDAARDGVECVEQVARLAPDVLILDLEMPRMNGLEVLERLRQSNPHLPVIMCSSHTERGARATLDALARGAADYVMKPAGQRDFESALSSLAQQLLPRIAAFAGGQVRSTGQQKEVAKISQTAISRTNPVAGGSLTTAVEVVVIGVSTGGPTALEQLLPEFASDLPVPILIVQHMPKVFTHVLAERLDRCCSLHVQEAYHGAPLRRGTVWLAPGDIHMEIEMAPSFSERYEGGQKATQVKLHDREPLHYCRPAVDYLFYSAARVYGAGTLALVLTGMGSDGLEGARAIHQRGGVVLAQDEATSAVWGMPGRIVESGIADATLPLRVMSREVNQRVRANSPLKTEVSLRNTTTGPMREVIHGLH